MEHANIIAPTGHARLRNLFHTMTTAGLAHTPYVSADQIAGPVTA